MVEYTLPSNVKGSDLILALEQAANSFEYGIKVESLQETCRNISTFWWDLFGSGVDYNRRYNGLPIKEVDERIKSVIISDTQPFTKVKKGEIVKTGESSTLWSAEAIIDPERVYSSLEVDMYKGDGLKRKTGLRFVHIAKAQPLKSNNGMLHVKPAVDVLVSKVKEIIAG